MPAAGIPIVTMLRAAASLKRGIKNIHKKKKEKKAIAKKKAVVKKATKTAKKVKWMRGSALGSGGSAVVRWRPTESVWPLLTWAVRDEVVSCSADVVALLRHEYGDSYVAARSSIRTWYGCAARFARNEAWPTRPSGRRYTAAYKTAKKVKWMRGSALGSGGSVVVRWRPTESVWPLLTWAVRDEVVSCSADVVALLRHEYGDSYVAARSSIRTWYGCAARFARNEAWPTRPSGRRYTAAYKTAKKVKWMRGSALGSGGSAVVRWRPTESVWPLLTWAVRDEVVSCSADVVALLRHEYGDSYVAARSSIRTWYGCAARFARNEAWPTRPSGRRYTAAYRRSR